MKPSALLALVLVAAPHLVRAEEDCGCSGAPAKAAAPATVPATPLVLAPGAPGEKLLLRLKMPAGQKYAMSMAMDQRSTSIVGQQKINMGFKFNIGMALQVLSVSPEGNMTVRYTFTDYRMKMEGLPTGMGTSKKAQNAAAATIKTMTSRTSTAFRGQSLTGVLSPEGRTLSVSGVEGLMKAVLAAAPGGDPAERQKTASMMQGMVKNFGNKNNDMFRMSGQFPDHAVAVGDTWTATQNITQPMFSLSTASTYALEARENGTAKIGIVMKMSSPPAKSAKPKADAMQMNLSGGSKGTMEIDEASGMVRHSELTTLTANKIRIPNGGKHAAPTSITTYGNAHIVMDVTPVS